MRADSPPRRRALAGLRWLLLILAGLTVQSAQAAVSIAPPPRYLDCSAAQPGDGSQQHPFKDLRDLNQRWPPGTALYLKRGVTCHGQLRTRGSGTAQAPNLIGAYGAGSMPAMIAGDGLAGAGAQGAAVVLLNQQYWQLQDLDISNHGSHAAERNGLLVILQDWGPDSVPAGPADGTGHHYWLRRLRVHDVNGADDQNKLSNGIQFRVVGTRLANHFDDMVVEDSVIEHVDREGLSTASSQNCRPEIGCSGHANWNPLTRLVIRNNTIRDIGGDGMVIRVSRGALITGNLGDHLAQRSHYSNAGFWTINSDDTLFRDNEVEFTARHAGNNDGTAFDADFANHRPHFEHNYSHDNQGGFMLLCGGCGGKAYSTDVVIADNLSLNDHRAIVIADGAGVADHAGRIGHGVLLANNTIYIASGLDTDITYSHLDSYKTSIDFIGNTIANRGAGGYLASSSNFQTRWQHNRFFGNRHGRDPLDPDGRYADPHFAGPLPTANAPAASGYAGAAIKDHGQRRAIRQAFGLP